MKKLILLLTLAFALLLGGCCSHQWTEASCTEPKTCSQCGETEGVALGHDFTEATCTEPKACLRCGETEGVALGHDFTEPNYQDCAVCTRCGEEGEKLTADFEKYGLETIELRGGAALEADIPCVTGVNKNKSVKTVGTIKKAVFGEIGGEFAEELFLSSGLDAREDYAWYIFQAEVLFNDDNANQYGIRVGSCYEDYYDIIGHDNSIQWDETLIEMDGSDYAMYHYLINWHGESMDAWGVNNEFFGKWANREITYYRTEYLYLPRGYDGIVSGFYARTGELWDHWPEGAHIFDIADENSVFFRLCP